MDKWLADGVLHAEENFRTIMRLDWPVAHFVVAGSWKILALDGARRAANETLIFEEWRRCSQAIVSSAHLAHSGCSGRSGGIWNRDVEKANMKTPDMFNHVLVFLRKFACTILGSVSNDEQGALGDYMQTLAQWLDDCARTLSSTTWAKLTWSKLGIKGGIYNTETKSYGQYDSFFIMNVVIMTFHLRGTTLNMGPDPYKVIVQRAMKTLPPEAQSVANQIISDGRYPSAPVISRARLINRMVGLIVLIQHAYMFYSFLILATPLSLLFTLLDSKSIP